MTSPATEPIQTVSSNDVLWHRGIDHIDREVIGVLTTDARMSLREIGDIVGLSAPAVKRRIDRLVATGVIQSFTITVDPRALGNGAEAFVEVHCHGRTGPKEIMKELSRFPEVVFACTVTGDADALVHVAARDISHLEETLENLRSTPSIERTRSSVVLTRLIERPAQVTSTEME